MATAAPSRAGSVCQGGAMVTPAGRSEMQGTDKGKAPPHTPTMLREGSPPTLPRYPGTGWHAPPAGTASTLKPVPAPGRGGDVWEQGGGGVTSSGSGLVALIQLGLAGKCCQALVPVPPHPDADCSGGEGEPGLAWHQTRREGGPAKREEQGVGPGGPGSWHAWVLSLPLGGQ